MKIFDIDWTLVLRALPVWETLSPRTQLFLLHLKPSTQISRVMAEAYADELIEHGFLKSAGPKGTQFQITEERRPMVRVLRAMARHPMLEQPTHETMVGYLADHFAGHELREFEMDRMWERSGYVYANSGTVATFVAEPEWVEHFLAAKSIAGIAPAALAIAQEIVRDLCKCPDGIPLSELVDRQRKDKGSAGQPRLAAALHAGLGRLVVFGALRSSDNAPMITLWPPIARELTRAAPAPPKPVVPAETFHLAVVVEDMTIVLAAAAADPFPIRADAFVLYARAQQAIEQRLAELPEWFVDALSLTPARRVDFAITTLIQLGLLVGLDEGGSTRVGGRSLSRRGSVHLHPTVEGTAWLARSLPDRVAAVLDAVRESSDRVPRRWYDSQPGIGFFSDQLSVTLYSTQELDLRTPLTRAFVSIPEDSAVPIEGFLEYHARSGNPFLTASGKYGAASITVQHNAGFGYATPNSRESLRQLWRELLSGFLVHRLVYLGGARMGRLPDNRFCFSLTDIGRYLLGAGQTFTYHVDVAGDAIVQPNFEIVFLAPAPVLEARLTRFAERTGQRTGVLFRLTRASVLAAAEGGMPADEMLGVLREVSSKEIPANVVHQLRGWVAGVRHVTLRRTMLLECQDAETAAQVCALMRERARPVTATILEVAGGGGADAKLDSTLIRRLRQAAVFVTDDAVRATGKR